MERSKSDQELIQDMETRNKSPKLETDEGQKDDEKSKVKSDSEEMRYTPIPYPKEKDEGIKKERPDEEMKI